MKVGEVLGMHRRVGAGRGDAGADGERRGAGEGRGRRPAPARSNAAARRRRRAKAARGRTKSISRSVRGSGDAGRVMRRDVEQRRGPSSRPPRSRRRRSRAAPAPRRRSPRRPVAEDRRRPEGERTEERVRMSKRRATIAKRLVEAQQTAAMLTTFNEVDMTAVMALRERHKEAFKERHGVGLGHRVVLRQGRRSARCRAFPRINAEIQGDEMVLKHYYDIGVAVGASEGLVVPVLRDADRMSFAEIETADPRLREARRRRHAVARGSQGRHVHASPTAASSDRC